jgi:hypothetical protein
MRPVSFIKNRFNISIPRPGIMVAVSKTGNYITTVMCRYATGNMARFPSVSALLCQG